MQTFPFLRTFPYALLVPEALKNKALHLFLSLHIHFLIMNNLHLILLLHFVSPNSNPSLHATLLLLLLLFFFLFFSKLLIISHFNFSFLLKYSSSSNFILVQTSFCLFNFLYKYPAINPSLPNSHLSVHKFILFLLFLSGRQNSIFSDPVANQI